MKRAIYPLLAVAGATASYLYGRKNKFRSDPITIRSIPQKYVRDVAGSNAARRATLTNLFGLVPSHPEVFEYEVNESLQQMVEHHQVDPLAYFYASMHTVGMLTMLADIERRAQEFVGLNPEDKDSVTREELQDANFLFLKSWLSLLVRHGFVALNPRQEAPFEVAFDE